MACAEPAPTGPCASERFDDMKTLCLVQLAADEARTGKLSETCGLIEEERWREECWFRVGEELGASGSMDDAMLACGKAGQFLPYCITHAGLRARHTEEPLAAWEAAARASIPSGQLDHALDTLRSRWWFNRYYGSGAVPATPEDDPYARTAWALEAVRLSGGVVPPTVLSGPILSPERRVGRYDPPMQLPGEKDLPRVTVFGGGARLVGETPEEDRQIALLEALFFRPETTAEAFRPYLHDQRARVRYTAVRLFRILPSVDAEATLSAMKDDPDPIVRAHVADALKYRTWMGKGKRPTPAGP